MPQKSVTGDAVSSGSVVAIARAPPPEDGGFGRRLLAVTGETQGLPVRGVPEQSLIPSVWDYVVHALGRYQTILSLAPSAQRMFGEVREPSTSPPSPVPAHCSGRSVGLGTR